MNENRHRGMSLREISHAGVENGLAFLAASQHPSGSWDMSCHVAGSPSTPSHGLFSTTAVLLAVGDLLSDEVVQGGIDFIISCRNESGHWFFDPQLEVPDDADDTACALAAVARFRPAVTSPGDVNLLLSYWRDPHGPFRTWHPSSDETAEYWSFESTDDAIVNCNVLMALTELGVPISSAMLEASKRLLGTASSTRYYCGLSPILYAAARVELLADVTKEVRTIRPDSSWTSLQLSQWMTSQPDEAPSFADDLCALQSNDGGWPDDEWCTGNIVPPTVWGSRAASTAFAVEALVGMNPATTVNETAHE